MRVIYWSKVLLRDSSPVLLTQLIILSLHFGFVVLLGSFLLSPSSLLTPLLAYFHPSSIFFFSEIPSPFFSASLCRSLCVCVFLSHTQPNQISSETVCFEAPRGQQFWVCSLCGFDSSLNRVQSHSPLSRQTRLESASLFCQRCKLTVNYPG